MGAGLRVARGGVCESRTSVERQARRYWQCGGCQDQCNVVSSTLFEASRLPLTSWFLPMYLLAQLKTDVSALKC